jgi:DNA-directed RNA polymerase subunit N (RpoN/RPB10)
MGDAKMRRCFNCGRDIGVYADYDRRDTCGSQECERQARHDEQSERDEAHEQLDRDMGW